MNLRNRTGVNLKREGPISATFTSFAVSHVNNESSRTQVKGRGKEEMILKIRNPNFAFRQKKKNFFSGIGCYIPVAGGPETEPEHQPHKIHGYLHLKISPASKVAGPSP